MLTDELRAVIGIWSAYFINHSDFYVKFRIGDSNVIVWQKDDRILFWVNKIGTVINCKFENIIHLCQMIRLFLEKD